MYHFIRHGNSFNPEINGSVKQYSDHQCMIELRFSIPNIAKMFLKLLYAFNLFFFLSFLALSINDLFHNKFQLHFLIPLFIFVFALFLTNTGMDAEISNSM